jgi:phospholipid transport system substrate-binding protein
MMRSFSSRNLPGLGLLFLFLLITVTAQGAVSPLEQVRTTVQSIIGVMQDKELQQPDKREERQAKIMDYVNRRFDFEEMSKLTLASNWRGLTPEEKESFQELFADLLKNSYIGRIEAYSGEEVRFEKEIFDGEQRTRAMVYTKVMKSNQEIPINYKLLNKRDEWYVYDVLIEGVSLVRNYRTEFARIITKEKFAGLIKRMQEKIASREEAKK